MRISVDWQEDLYSSIYFGNADLSRYLHSVNGYIFTLGFGVKETSFRVFHNTKVLAKPFVLHFPKVAIAGLAQ